MYILRSMAKRICKQELSDRRLFLHQEQLQKTVSVSKAIFALRSAKAYDASNEIGELYTGDTVQVTDTKDSTYWVCIFSKAWKKTDM